MKALVKRTGMLAVVALVAALSMTDGLAAYMTECANFVTTGQYDDPVTGWLIGERTYSQTSTRTFNTSGTFGGIGGSSGFTQSTTVSYSIGTYLLSNGQTAELRCDTYRYA